VFDCSFETSNHSSCLVGTVLVSSCKNESNVLSISHIILVVMNIHVCPLAVYLNPLSYTI